MNHQILRDVFLQMVSTYGEAVMAQPLPNKRRILSSDRLPISLELVQIETADEDRGRGVLHSYELFLRKREHAPSQERHVVRVALNVRASMFTEVKLTGWPDNTSVHNELFTVGIQLFSELLKLECRSLPNHHSRIEPWSNYAPS